MDRVIAEFDCEADGDLCLCLADGVAYQSDMTAGRVTYDDTYMAKVKAYEGTDIAHAVNAGRVAMLVRQFQPIVRGVRVLDIGAGTGEFVRAAIRAGFVARGCDPMPAARRELCKAGLWCSEPTWFDAVCMWDTIEHMENPAETLIAMLPGAYLFASIPVFKDLTRIRESRHYRPGEHLYYWTEEGFVRWVEEYGFVCKERSNHEVEAGRDSIGAFAFRKIK